LIKKCDRESARRRTDTLTDANRFYNLSYAICYIYGTDTRAVYFLSVNEEVASDKLHEDVFEARRRICDHVNAVGCIVNIDITSKQL